MTTTPNSTVSTTQMANAIRALAMDAVQQANSGHPGAPMGMAEMAVALTAPAASALLYPANPERHHEMAALLEPGTSVSDLGRDALPNALRRLMRDIGFPNGLAAVGYSDADLARLVEGTMKQTRQLAVVPRPVTRDALTQIFRESL